MGKVNFKKTEGWFHQWKKIIFEIKNKIVV